jgi:hypothetical protein
VTEPAPSAANRDPTRFLTTFAAQLERERRSFLWRNVLFGAANLAGAGLVGAVGGRGALAWGPAGIVFLVDLFHALGTDWDERWKVVWRRELPRLEGRFGGYGLLTEAVRRPGRGRGHRWLKWTTWTLTAAWLVALILTIRASGFDPGALGRLLDRIAF